MCDYMNPTIHSGLDIFEVPTVRATPENLKGYGFLVDVYEECDFEIVKWPAQGWRSVDDGTGDEGGTTEGLFKFSWKGDVLYGVNEAVNDQYILGWSAPPDQASPDTADYVREKFYFRHANYHPDGGQMFFPQAKTPFVTPLALPGDDVTPADFVNFYCDGTQGLYMHPGVWHEAIMPLDKEATFLDKQGKVHARVSINFDDEFGVYMATDLKEPA